MPVTNEEYYEGKQVNGYNMFTPHRGYFITSSIEGLYLCGSIPHNYFVGNPFIGRWEPLPKPPPPQSFPQRALSVGLASDNKDGVINFRVLVATGCDEHYEKTGTRVMPLETYSSRTREWRKSKLLSEIPVAIQSGVPPTVSGGFFHWFTVTKRHIVVYDCSWLEEDGNSGGKLKKTTKKKKQNLQVIEVPNTRGGSQIVWRSDNRQTMWFGSCNERDGVEVYHKRDNGDDWALISKVDCLDRMIKEIIGITNEDIKNDTDRIAELRNIYPDLDPKMPREMVYMIAFMPWDPRRVIVRVMERLFIYNCIEQKMENEVELRGRSVTTENNMEWYPYFHSLSNSTYNFRHKITTFYKYSISGTHLVSPTPFFTRSSYS